MKVTATFSNGQTVSKNTKRSLTHAYQTMFEHDGSKYTYTGFAGSKELAKKAAGFGNYINIEVVEVQTI